MLLSFIIQTELQVVKGLLRDNEEARKRDQHTLENKTAELNRCLRETAELSRQVEEKANPHFLNGTDQDMDVRSQQCSEPGVDMHVLVVSIQAPC